jgi:hypothetical protein
MRLDGFGTSLRKDVYFYDLQRTPNQIELGPGILRFAILGVITN